MVRLEPISVIYFCVLIEFAVSCLLQFAPKLYCIIMEQMANVVSSSREMEPFALLPCVFSSMLLISDISYCI